MFEKVYKLFWALVAIVFIMAIVSQFFGYFVFIAILALLVAGFLVLMRRNAELRTRIRDQQRDLDRARRNR